ncbi:putative bifunctional diguanylate cyclase/phosphodiesterase [Rhodopseudomonas palustris]|uniref:putative bifunctional diguanylate cyclase/phosphodiesterase n=1 Tax=Rhodopseudomonas palustris TaxID=1076 RepID=UPI0021F37056|nr:bifunctional diguanylate cyclase/phosphodiesterase [Rhodopseudomonas palustris]UYO52287.1 bifunctional diguanylate cyclase/phosphodiesterase [Rhodopseudomonas palustris]
MTRADSSFKAIALAKAQARTTLRNVRLTLISNIAIALSLAALLYRENGETPILWWLGVAISLALFRAWWVSRLATSGAVDTAPYQVLRHLTLLALASGLLWGFVPAAVGVFSAQQGLDYVTFIMIGATTGAIIQGAAYSPVALAFATPVMAATLFRMMMSGNSSDYIILFDGVFLTFMLFRAAIGGEREFTASQMTALEATDLANSLASANNEVLNSNRALEQIARADPLTGLANRSHFRDAAAAACRSGQGVAFVLFDVDNFKTINDTRGHDAGDRVIAAVAELLRSSCGPHDLPVRLGGDEFIVVLQGDDVAARALALARRLSGALTRPLRVAGQPLAISCSIGIAAHPGGPIDVEDVFSRADAALYRAKDDGRACIRLFDARMQEEFLLQRCIDGDLPGALARGELHLEFQPQVVLATGQVVGFEALLRWRHPTAGLIPPPDIIHAAIRLQLSARLLSFIGDAACDFLRALDASGAPPVNVAVNVSPRELTLHSPAKILMDLTQRHGIDPHRIEIEITEEALFDPKQCARELQRIEHYGFGLAIDDFGVGHSSISNLMSVALDTIKIDRSFVHGVSANRQNQQLIAAITAVARPLGHRIIAEGVESQGEAETLRMLGCSYGQGWLYGRPMRAADAVAWLAGLDEERRSERQLA